MEILNPGMRVFIIALGCASGVQGGGPARARGVTMKAIISDLLARHDWDLLRDFVPMDSETLGKAWSFQRKHRYSSTTVEKTLRAAREAGFEPKDDCSVIEWLPHHMRT